MTKLLSRNDLCLAILSNKNSFASSENLQLSNCLSANYTSSDKDSQSLYSELNQFSKKELTAIQNELKAKELAFTDILFRHNFSFRQHIDLIRQVSNIFQQPQGSNSNRQNMACMIQLYSYLSLCMNNSEISKDYLEELINSFLISLESSYAKNNAKLHTAFSSCFYYLMKNYLQIPNVSEKFVINSIIMFFTEEKNTKNKSIFRIHNQKINKSVSSDYLILFSYAAKVFSNSHSKYLNDLIQLFDCMIQDYYTNNFPKEIAISFLKFISNAAPSIQSLIFIDHIMPFVEVDLVLGNLQVLPNSIISEIENSEEHFTDSNASESSKFLKLPENVTLSTNLFSMVTWKTFDKPIDFSADFESIKFPELIDFEKVIRAEVLEKISYILKIVQCDVKLVLKLFDLIQSSIDKITSSKYSIEIATSFLYLLVSILKSPKIKHKSSDKHLRAELLQFFPTNIFINDVVLNPSLTIYSYNENKEKNYIFINSLRSLLLDIFIEKGISSVNSVFYEIIYYPSLFAEFTYRFSLANVNIGKDEAIVLSPMFVYAMNYYVNFKELNDDELQSVNSARESIFYFFNKQFEDNEKVLIFFQDTFFIESILNLTFEYHPRQIILTYLIKYLQLAENLNNNECVNKINTLILSASNSLDDPQYAGLCTDYLKAINSILQNARLAAFYFTPLNTPLCENILKLKKGDEKSRLFIYEFITFLALTSDFHNISGSETDALRSAIVSSFGTEPPKELFIKMINLVAGQYLVTLNPSFDIRQPSILRTLLAIYLKSTILSDLFSFVGKLLQSSTKNCIEAHKGEVDMFLIDLLYKWRNDKEISINLVASAMSLFMLISKTISSFAVVQKFISLFSPIHRRYLSKYHNLIIKSMCNIIESVRKNPLSCLPLREPCTFEIEGLKGEQLDKGFSISFWIFHYSNTPNYKVQIFSIRDSKGQKVALFLQGNTIYTEFNMSLQSNEPKGTQWSRTADIQLNENDWNLIVLTFEHDTDTTTVKYSLNNTHYSTASIFPYILSLGFINAQIGGFSCNVTDYPSLMKSFGIFGKLTNSQIDYLYQMGVEPRNVNLYKTELKSVCFFISSEKDGQICLTNVCSNPSSSNILNEIRLKKDSIQSVIPNNFCSVYLKKFNLCMILPLFAQWNLYLEDGSSIPNLQDLTIELLSNSLTFLTDAQSQFAASGGFTILLHLLRSSDPKFITFKLYTQLFSLFESLTDHKCKEQLYSTILMNIDLWLKASPSDHLQILQHWTEKLFPKTKEFALKLRPISWFLSVLRNHYWYTPAEKYSISIDEKRSPELNVSECRSFLIQIIKNLAQIKIEENDFSSLISNILTCRDSQQNEELLKFLNYIIIDCDKSLMNVKDSLKLISLLQYLFNSQDVNVICTSLQIISLSHNNGLITNFSLDSHVDLILHQLTSSFVTKPLLSQLLDITKNGVPELFPICSWAAMNIGDNAMREMLTTLKPSKSYETNEFWAIWPIVALFKSDEKLQRFIARYLIKCSTHYHYLFATCEIVGRALREDIDKIKKIIVVEFGKLLLRDDYNAVVDEVVEYFLLVKHYLFYHSQTQQNPNIMNEFENSPFNTNGEKIIIPNSPKQSPRKERRRKARYSIRRDSIENSGYSEVDQEKSISFLNPEQSKIVSYDDSLHANLSPVNYKSKRTSLFTIGHATFTNQKKKHQEKKILSMTPLELDNKIRAIASDPISYTFGLKLIEKMKWNDFDVAQQAISVFLKDPDTRVAETILLICSFAIHYSINDIKFVISKLNLHDTRLNEAFSFFIYHCKLCNIKTTDFVALNINSIKPTNYIQSIENKNDKMISASPLMLLKHLLKFESNNAAISMDISEMINESVVGLSSSLMAKYTDDYGNLLDTASKLWNQNWRSMSMDKAPWHRSISKINKMHFKRDFTLCSNLCPMKLQRNYNFDDHMEASLLRDTGSVVSTQKMLDKYKEELTVKYNNEANVYTLFEVVEDKSVIQQNNFNQIDPFDDSTNDNNNNNNISNTETKCIVELPCEFVKVTKTKAGIFALLPKSILLTKSEKKTIVIDLADIRNIFLRTRFHHPTAIEIFTVFGKSYFINFPNLSAIPILKTIKTAIKPHSAIVQTTDFVSYFQSKKITDDWINRRISNFEYLMNLNMLSGRSFNDTSQYPILPWIINDYETEKLDLTNPKTFRDLSKPVGALTEERLQQLIDKWQQLDAMGIDSYLYSSGYVCPLSVYLWLIRQEPFTSLHINLQSGKFDYPARLFTSISTTYNTSTHQPNDYRELIPEFYSSPEFLFNSNKFDLGSQNGKKVDDVELPNWASNPYEFVYLMRKALESEYVSEHINLWIDLIWGDKQKGEKAKKANNIFLKEMYEDIWNQQNLSDPNERANIEAILCCVGQIPTQLFDKPHPNRASIIPPSFAIDKPVMLEMPTSHLITSSINLNIQQKKKIINISAVDLSGQLIEIVFPLSFLNENNEKKVIFKRRSSKDLFQSKSMKIPHEFIISSQISKFCQTARKDSFSTLSKGKFTLVSANGYDLILADTISGNSSLFIHHRSEIVQVATSQNSNEWIIIADRDAYLTLYHQNKFKYTLQTFMKSITCLSMNFGFREVVCGTSDNSLLFCSINSNYLSIFRVVELEEGFQPIKIVITNCWGFVVVYLTKINERKLNHYLALYSINGDLINRVEIGIPIQQLETYSSNDGFDFVIARDDSFNLYSFEAFFLDLKDPFYNCDSSLSSLLIIPEKSLAVQVTQEGKIIFIPYVSQ